MSKEISHPAHVERAATSGGSQHETSSRLLHDAMSGLKPETKSPAELQKRENQNKHGMPKSDLPKSYASPVDEMLHDFQIYRGDAKN